MYTQCYSVRTSHISLMSDLGHLSGRERELGNYSLLCCMCTIPLRESHFIGHSLGDSDCCHSPCLSHHYHPSSTVPHTHTDSRERYRPTGAIWEGVATLIQELCQLSGLPTSCLPTQHCDWLCPHHFHHSPYA